MPIRNRISFAWSGLATVVLMALLFVTTPFSLPTHAQGTPIPTATIDPLFVLQQAQSAVERADRASVSADNTVSLINTLFAALQALSIVLLGALSVAGWIYLRTFQVRIDSYQKLMDEFNTNISASKTQMEDMNRDAVKVMDEIKAIGEKTSRANALLQLAEQQLDQSNLNSARDLLVEASTLDPNNRAVNYYLGEVYIQLEDFSRAQEFLKQTASSDGKLYAPAEAALGLVYTRLGRNAIDDDQRNDYFVEAEKAYRNALKTDSNVRDANKESIYASLGGLYQRRGLIEDAISAYRKATEITPESTYPRLNLARLAFRKGDLTVAGDAFRNVIGLLKSELAQSPLSYWPRTSLVTAYAALNQAEEAVKEVEVLDAQNPPRGAFTSLKDGLIGLRDAPHSPAGIDQVIAAVDRAIVR